MQSVFSLLSLATLSLIAALPVETESSHIVLAAQKTVNMQPVNPGRVLDPGGHVSMAQIGLNCGGTTYSISTGTGKGTCHGGKTWASCHDGKNTSAVSCSKGCKKTKGDGICIVAK